MFIRFRWKNGQKEEKYPYVKNFSEKGELLQKPEKVQKSTFNQKYQKVLKTCKIKIDRKTESER